MHTGRGDRSAIARRRRRGRPGSRSPDGERHRRRRRGVLRRHPAARRAGPRPPASTSASAAACVVDEQLPHLRPARLRDRRVRRARRPDVRPGRARLRDGRGRRRPPARRRRRRSPAPTCPPSSSCSASTSPPSATRSRSHRAARSSWSSPTPVAGRLQEAGRLRRRHAGCSAAILVGDASAYGLLRPLVASGMRAARQPRGADPPGGAAAPRRSAMPDEAQVCSCNNVTKGAICAAIAEQGCADVAARQGVHPGRHRPAAPASRWSRSCSPSELEAAGTRRRDRRCASTSRYTRQELFDLVAVHGITALRRHRRGARHAAAAATSASRRSPRSWPASSTAHVLDGEHRDPAGHQRPLTSPTSSATAPTRSCPRIPGGEITPEKLIVIGEVARDFGLYTKITGGQRIDLFGARVEQLPAIWRRLVDAGFESGHAYGKALRTVKSCVGSTWCRYGVQDSVALAIDLELRYRGLRSPHKLKGGVSGCARECAEARGKDFGVIATEKGWNLYVGGNGGATPAPRRAARRRPRHRDAGPLPRPVPHVLHPHRRPAAAHRALDRARSTAAWTASARSSSTTRSASAPSWRRRWPRHVDAYADEWKATLDDPDKLARFVSFVNAPGHPGPEHQLHAPSAARSQPADVRPGRSSLGTHDPGRERHDASPEMAAGLPPSTRSRSSGGVAALVDGAGGRDLPDPRRRRLRAVATTTRSRRRRCWPAASSAPAADVPFVASPMHKQAFDLRTGQCLDDAARPGPDVRRAGGRRRRARRVAGRAA